MHVETAQQLYTTLEGARYSYLDRGRACSKLTLPYVMPEEGFGPHSRLETPFSGVGSRGVNNLASKLLLALLPPNSPFFRFQANEKKLAEDETPPELMSEIEASLQALEELVMDEVTRGAYRVALHEALKHLIITGNALLYLPDEGGLRVFHLDRFVVQRDPMGNLLSVATKESVAFSTLSEEIRQRLQQQDPNLAESDAKVDLFTSCKRKAKHWVITQDVNGVDIPYAGGKVTMDRNPFIPLRLSRIDGEDKSQG